jgi:hypothetical protein
MRITLFTLRLDSRSEDAEMMKRPSLILGVALLLLSAERTWSDGGEAGPRAASTLEATAEKIAANDQDLLAPQSVVQCAAAGHPLDPDDPATTSAIPRADRFVAQDHFREDVSSSAAVEITWLGAMFRQRFLSKIEGNVGGAILRRFVLRRSSPNAEIIAGLNIHHETQLADVWCLLLRQPNGEAGTLLTNAIPNVFYIRDADDVLRAVDAVWGGAGWEIGASPIDGSHQWPSYSQVIAR